MTDLAAIEARLADMLMQMHREAAIPRYRPDMERLVRTPTGQSLAAEVRSLRTPPHGTRLVVVSENLLEHFGTRTEDGRRLTAEWGEPSPEGWYTPTFTAHDPPLIADLRGLAVELRDIIGPEPEGLGSSHSCWATFHLAKARVALDHATAILGDTP